MGLGQALTEEAGRGDRPDTHRPPRLSEPAVRRNSPVCTRCPLLAIAQPRRRQPGAPQSPGLRLPTISGAPSPGRTAPGVSGVTKWGSCPRRRQRSRDGVNDQSPGPASPSGLGGRGCDLHRPRGKVSALEAPGGGAAARFTWGLAGGLPRKGGERRGCAGRVCLEAQERWHACPFPLATRAVVSYAEATTQTRSLCERREEPSDENLSPHWDR